MSEQREHYFKEKLKQFKRLDYNLFVLSKIDSVRYVINYL